MIKISDLEIGKWVEYTGNVGEKEKGRIKSWKDNWVFVVYKCNHEWDRYQDFTGNATDPKQLEFCDELFDYYKAPSQEVFENIKENAMKLWDIVDTDNDKYGYATEKKNRIKDIENVQDNAWYIVAMFDQGNISILLTMLSQNAREKVAEVLSHQYD